MNFKTLRLAFILLSLIFFVACQTRKIRFDRKNISKLEQKGYQIKFDSINVKMGDFVISKNKIDVVFKHSIKKTIQIKSTNQSKIIKGENILIYFNSKDLYKNDLIIVNGFPYYSKTLLIDFNSIIKMVFMSKKEAQQHFPHKNWESDLVIIQTQ